MSQYIFGTRRKGKSAWKWTEFSLWLGIFIYISFIYFTVVQTKTYKGLIETHPLIVPFAMVLFFLLVYFPTKNSMKLQKYASMIIETSRKGMHYKDFQQDLSLSWRDIRNSTLVLTIHPVAGVIPRDFSFRHAKGRISLTHDPVLHPLEGYLDFIKELKERIPELKQEFVSTYNFCPFCGNEKKDNQCSCGEKVRFVHLLKRPLYIIKSDIIVMLIASLFLGVRFLPFVIVVLLLFLGVPLFLLRKRKFKTINMQISEIRHAEKAAAEAEGKAAGEAAAETEGEAAEEGSGEDPAARKERPAEETEDSSRPVEPEETADAGDSDEATGASHRKRYPES